METDNPILARLNGVALSPPQTPSLPNFEPRALEEAKIRAEPAAHEAIVRALSSCLILTAPAGFSEGDKRAWLTSAAMTLQGVPAQLLERGVSHARRLADHPSKIVPIIMEEIGECWERRRKDLARERGCYARQFEARIEPPKPEIDRCTPEEAAAILAEFPGLKPQTREMLTQHVGPRRKPTRQDYIDMGVDPSVLDQMQAG